MNARTLAITRAVAVIGGTGALIAGATFAAVGDNVGTASLTANTFAATFGLQISNNNTSYSNTASGFNFGTVSPAGAPSATQNFWLEDVTGNPHQLSVNVALANYETFPGLDTSKVMVNIEKEGSGVIDKASLATLAGAGLALSSQNLPSTGTVQTPVPTKYDVWVNLGAGAITGSLDPTKDHFDLNFAGTSND